MARPHARFALLLAAAIAGLMLVAGGAGAGTGSTSANEMSTAWFVQLAGAPAVKGGSKAVLKAQKDAFLKNAAAMGLSVTERDSFDTLWNGLSVSVPLAQAGALATVPGAVAVYPVNLDIQPAVDSNDTEGADGQLPITGGTSSPDLSKSTTMIGSNVANAAGYTGQGVKVAIIDSGVDYTHPDLGAGFGPGHKVVGGYDLIGNDLFDSNPADSTYNPVRNPDNDPAPCDPVLADQRAQQPGAGSSAAAHGTHVTGIVAAKAASASGVTGVAPDASILAYRVFGCNGSTSDDIMIEAMERAYNDGARVVNMSIGDAFNNFPDSPDAVAASNLVDRGVNVVVSAGNSGANGLFSTGAPSVGRKVISVASVQNLSFPAPTFDVTNGTDTLHVTYLRLADTTEAPTSGAAGEIVYVGRGCAVANANPGPDAGGHPQDPVPAGGDPYLADPAGKVALVVRGVCSFNEKYARAVGAGATAVVIMNDGATPDRVGHFNGGFTTDLGKPGVTITYTDGVAIRNMTGTKNMTWTSNVLEAADPLAGFISSFSSWGMDSELNLKPDISAPGGNIKSTWPLTQFGGYNVISGTSMAAPHVAGSVADYLQAHPTATPAAVANALRNTAVPFNGINSTRFDSTAREGAGLVKVPNAINSVVSISPSKISLGQGHGGTADLTLTNDGATDVTYSLSTSRALAEDPFGGNYPFTFGTFSFGNIVSFSKDGSVITGVTVPAHGSTTIRASMQEPGWDDKAIWGGWLNFQPTSGSTQLLRVPFGGFVGDYQDTITPLGNGGCSLPMLAKFGAATDHITCATGNPSIDGFVGMPTGGTWASPKQDPIVFLWHLDHQVQELKVTLVDAATGQPVTAGGRNPVLFDSVRVKRNSTATAFSGMVWDGMSTFTANGKTLRKAVPGGTYKLVLTATKVKAFNDSRAAQTQTITSAPITLRDG